MLRSSVPSADEILGLYFPVLDHGFVSLVDYMGGDVAIERAARVSYGAGTRKTNETRGLIRYLKRHAHCYRGDMEVLTARGWIRWSETLEEEVFLVPDPSSKSLKRERLRTEVFEIDEDLVVFESARMSFAVTQAHRMWFKGKYSKQFEIVRAGEMSRWGHFDPLSGYRLVDREGESDPRMQFFGFALGDGHFINSEMVSFHLKKERKKIYLRELIGKLGLECTEQKSSSCEGAEVFYVKMSGLHDVVLHAVAHDKNLCPGQLNTLTDSGIRGLFDGLVNSDGSWSKERPQISFSSASLGLLDLFQTLAAFMGIDAHRRSSGNGETHQAVAYYGERTTLESRAQYFATNRHAGKVYCATTSTGLLMVRGGADKFAFVCGNSSPFEMAELTLHCCMPIFVARQWIRHRTANLNEQSARYSVMPMVFYTPEREHVQLQSKDNKQGRAGEPVSEGAYWDVVKDQEELRAEATGLYSNLMTQGVARELARIDLPLSTYTQWYWKIDLHNLMHFLRLRCDAHAQYEIRAFANVMAGILQRVAPLTFEAWVDYDLMAQKFSRLEIAMLATGTTLGNGRSEKDVAVQYGISVREVKEFFEKLNERPELDFSLDLKSAKSAEHYEEMFTGAVPVAAQ